MELQLLAYTYYKTHDVVATKHTQIYRFFVRNRKG